MSQTVFNILNVALILLEACMLLILTDGFFNRKRSAVFTGASFGAVVLINCILIYFVGHNLAAKLSSTSVFFIVWIYCCYDVSPIKCLFPVSVWLAFLGIGDNAILSMLSVLLDKAISELVAEPSSFYLICFSTKIVELLGIVIIHTWMKRNFTQAYSGFFVWLRVMAFPAGSLLISVLLLRIYYNAPEMSWELMICNAVVLLVDILSIFLLNYLEKQQEAIRDNIILRQNMKTELDNVEAWRRAYDGQRKQTHDFKNQLIVIQGLVQQQVPAEEVLGYIERLQSVQIPGNMIVKTHRTVVDIILNQKYAIAESLGIQFTTQLDDLSDFPLKDDALITVLSNLIDNAIEACEKLGDTRSKKISLKMKVEPQAAFIYIENQTAAPVQIVNNRILTTKKNPMEHGYGLQNIISVLEKNKAIYLLNYDEQTQVFSFSAQIPLT